MFLSTPIASAYSFSHLHQFFLPPGWDGQVITARTPTKRLERQRDHPANPGPDPETVAEWARLWIEAGMEEPRATVAALEFLIHCQSTGVTPTIAALNKWAHCESEG